jgi:hypothetical protein
MSQRYRKTNYIRLNLNQIVKLPFEFTQLLKTKTLCKSGIKIKNKKLKLSLSYENCL